MICSKHASIFAVHSSHISTKAEKWDIYLILLLWWAGGGVGVGLLHGGAAVVLATDHLAAPWPRHQGLGWPLASAEVLQHVIQPPVPLRLAERRLSRTIHAHRGHHFSEMASIYGWSQPWVTICHFCRLHFLMQFRDKWYRSDACILCLSLYQIGEGGCYGVIPSELLSPRSLSRCVCQSVRTVWPAWLLLASDWSLRPWLGLWLNKRSQDQDMRAFSEVFQIIKSWELFKNKHPNVRSRLKR